MGAVRKWSSNPVLFCFLNRQGLNVGSRELSAGAIKKPFTVSAVVFELWFCFYGNRRICVPAWLSGFTGTENIAFLSSLLCKVQPATKRTKQAMYANCILCWDKELRKILASACRLMECMYMCIFVHPHACVCVWRPNDLLFNNFRFHILFPCISVSTLLLSSSPGVEDGVHVSAMLGKPQTSYSF